VGALLPSPPLLFPICPSLPFFPVITFLFSLTSLLPLPFPLLEVGPPKIQLRGLGNAVSSPSGDWGKALAEIKFDAF